VEAYGNGAGGSSCGRTQRLEQSNDDESNSSNNESKLDQPKPFCCFNATNGKRLVLYTPKILLIYFNFFII